MTVTVVAQLIINEDEPQALGKYFEITAPLLKAAQAKIVSRYKKLSSVVGCDKDYTIVVVEYPSEAAVRLVFDSLAYKNAEPYRDRAFKEYQVNIYTSETS